ncbi:MAG TPA: hypothetical protein VF194_11225 [Ferrovibrio sp.]|jgi:DNA-binding NarL/FixJ family response regulator|uniref:hypothetical protein n=1 Tax=Ferrovibrio sp. TaxID=1917215 RepID=UPI002ED33B79
MAYDLSQIDLLIVDRDETAWRGLLGGLGIRQPRFVPDARRAWAALAEAQAGSAKAVDILICRWELPHSEESKGAADVAAEGGTGLDLIRELRRGAASPAPFMPAILVTATITRERVREALDAGVNEILVLPLSAKSVEARLREIIERPRKFIRGGTYFGPDRRRTARADYPGPYRRQDDKR